MPKFLILEPAVRKGEIYCRYKEYIKVIKELGFTVDIILPKNIGNKSKFGIRSIFSIFVQIIKEGRKYDIVIIPTKTLLFFYVFLFKKLFKKKVIIDHIASYVSITETYKYFPYYLEKWSYRSVDGVVTFTKTMQDLIVKEFALTKNKTYVIYCLTDEKLFAQHKYKDETRLLREKFGIEDKFVVFYHGMHNPWHGLEYILQAAKMLEQDDRFVFMVLPAGRLDPNKYKNVILIPEQSLEEIPTYLNIANIWCSGVNDHPIAERLFTTTMIQAMLMGKPIMTSRNEEKSYYFEDKESVIFVKHNSAEDIVSKLKYYIDHKNELNTIAQNCFNNVSDKFTMKYFKKTLLEIKN